MTNIGPTEHIAHARKRHVSEWTQLPDPSLLTPEQVAEIREAAERAAPVSDDRIAAAFARQPGDYP